MSVSEGSGSERAPQAAPGSASQTPRPADPSDLSPRRWFGGWSLRRLGGGLVVAAAALVVFLVGGKILADRTDRTAATYGTILVETPQVYTRERLVNDRLMQESWLREVLNEKQNFSVVVERVGAAERRTTAVSVGGGGSGSGEAKPAVPANEAAVSPGSELKFPPALEFNLRNSYREAVRAHLIENQLDDRHDMRGTTLYLLKFDTAILPGVKTRQPAFVRVSIRHYEATEEEKPKPEKSGDDKAAEAADSEAAKEASVRNEPDASFRERDTPERYIRSYLNDPDDESSAAGENYKLYMEWVTSLRDRLNAVFWEQLNRFNSNEFRYNDYYQMLSAISERRAKHLFHSWASALAKIRNERDDLLGGLDSAARQDNDAGAATRDGKKDRLTEVELDHRFHFLSKHVLWNAAADIKPALASTDVRLMLRGDQPLLDAPEDDAKLRDALFGYLVRHVGKYVVGDNSFSLADFPDKEDRDADQEKQKAAPSVAVISSRTLDGFIDMVLENKGDRNVYEIDVKPRVATLYALRLAAHLQGASKDGKCDIDAPDFTKEYQAVTSYKPGMGRDIGIFHGATERIDLSSRDARQALQEKWLRIIFSRKTPAFYDPNVLKLPKGYEACFDFKEARRVPVGYIRFVYGILDMQTYTYATLPRMDIQIAETGQDFSSEDRLAADVEAAKTSGVLANEYRRTARAFQPKNTVVGFSGYCRPAQLAEPSAGAAWRSWFASWWSEPPPSRRPPFCDVEPFSSDELRFGWVLSPPYETMPGQQSLTYSPMHPSQRSLSSLVTVPSWWRRVSVYVHTGWVNGDGSLITTGEVSYPVTLPIDYESLDAILIGPARRDSHRPTIALERLPEQFELEACQPAEILIPGRRLWRSTVVVLGGQQAREVLVLPDMRGVIAKFPPISPRGAWEDKNGKTVRELQVWTSEGRAAGVAVRIKGPSGPCHEKPAPSGGGKSDQQKGGRLWSTASEPVKRATGWKRAQ
jgi:hypothetical protein